MRTLPVLTAALLFTITASVAQETAPPGAGNLRQLLQQGLFEEEASRDMGKAAAAYSAIVAEYETQRSFAATALFRLAEIRAKQGNKAEAIALHQRLLAEFPGNEELAKLSKERLATLGGALPAAAAQSEAPTEAEAKELIRLREIVQNSPDLLNSPGGEQNTTPLIQAASNGWLVAAAFLLDHGADVNLVQNNSPLQIAALQGHKRMVELLLARGASVNLQNGMGETALYKACEGNRMEVARVLLEHGADPNAVTKNLVSDSGTPLHMAIQGGHLPLVRLLLDHKADPNGLNASGYPPLATAVVKKNEVMVKELLARGVDVNVSSRGKETVLHLALMPDGWPEIVPLLLEHGASVKAVASVPAPGSGPIEDRTPLHLAIYLFKSSQHVAARGVWSESEKINDADLAKLYKLWEALLAKGADINARDANGITPLHLAAVRSDLPADAAIWLVERGGDLEATDKNGSSVLDYAGSAGIDRRLELERRYRFSQWAKENAVEVRIYCSGVFAQRALTIGPAADGESPTVRNILARTMENLKGDGPAGFEFRVYRAKENGEFVERARIPLKVGDALPASIETPLVQWGDIVILSDPSGRREFKAYSSKDRIQSWLQSPASGEPAPEAPASSPIDPATLRKIRMPKSEGEK